VPDKGNRYSPEFKEQAARKVVDGPLPIVRVARELGINESTLGFWVKDYRKKLARQPFPSDMHSNPDPVHRSAAAARSASWWRRSAQQHGDSPASSSLCLASLAAEYVLHTEESES